MLGGNFSPASAESGLSVEGSKATTACPVPEIARLGKTLRQWRSEFLGYFDTGGANNGGTEAINGLIELH